MKKLKYLALTFLLVHSFAYSQKCVYKNLSKHFSFEVKVNRMKDSCQVLVSIFQKKSARKIQTVQFTADYIFENDFTDCSTVRSYTTHVNDKLPDTDNDFGNLIVADFNFDGFEDIAVKRNSGGNGGPMYAFYLQKDRTFYNNQFLTETMAFFPSQINKSQHTLTTLVHANAYQQCKKVFQYDPEKEHWKLIRKVFVDY